MNQLNGSSIIHFYPMMEKFGICLQALIAVRDTPSERAELVSQLLFGEHYIITEFLGNWAKIHIIYDQYEGWIDKKLVTQIDVEQFNRLNSIEPSTSQKVISPLEIKPEGTKIPLVAGSSLPFIDNNGLFKLAGHEFHYHFKLEPVKASGTLIAGFAKQFINAPYLWGGKSVLGFDCSGLTQVVYKMGGIKLPRDASQQINLGTSVNFIYESLPGDLAFFDNEEGQIIHVGILVDNGHIIHASGCVRSDRIDHQGIYHTELQKYTHKLRVIKRII